MIPIGQPAATPAGSSLYVEKVRLINELQRDQKSLKAQVLVALSKFKWAVEREEFILQEITRASEAMKCQFSESPRVLYFPASS
jgi:hypothetical protein